MFRNILLGILLLGFNAVHSQVTLKQVGKETVLFSDVFIEVYNHYLYTIENTGALYKTDLETGAHTRLGKATYKNTRFLFAANGNLYCIEKDGSMNRIDVSSGDWTVVSPMGSWNDIEKVIIVGNKFYSTQNGALYYHPTMNDKVKKAIGEAEFYDMGNFSRTDTTLHTIIGGTLYRIDVGSGKWKQIGPKKAWKMTRDNAVIGSKLYSIETPNALYETDLTNGNRKLLDDAQFKEAQVLIADSGKLYAIFSLGVLYEVVLPAQ